MLCSKCGNVVEDGCKFCSYCGNNLTNNNPNQIVQNNYINKTGISKAQKAIIISLLSFVIILLIIATMITFKKSNKLHERSGDGSRTVMIYMVGSNLESDSKIATSEIEAINPEKVDLDKVNILLYTGGTKKWHNFIENDENAIYKLTEDGFEKIKEYDKKNMGDYKTFLNFLNYGYENYVTQYYDLILYDHGGAIHGAIYDDFTNDNLSLAEFDKALNESKFSSENKLNTVLFRTCLNGTIEVATTFAPYANYLISSEEVTNGKTGQSVLNFLNEVDENDDEISYGKKFIKAYEEQMENIDPFKSSSNSMYSIVDLSKVEKINDLFDEFISGIDLKANYKDIVRIRSNMYQYGYSTYDVKDYDTVDLYTLVSKLSKYSSENSDELLNAIDDAIVHNWSDLKDSNGLSIYFPNNGSEQVQQMFLNIYKDLDNNAYYKFINQFNGSSTSKNFSSFSKSDLTQNKTVINGQEFSLQLTEEQAKDYAQSIYIVFRKNEDGRYTPIYSSDNNELTDSGLLKTNISNNLIKLYDKSDATDQGGYLFIIDRQHEDKRVLRTTAVLHNYKPGMSLDEMTTTSAIVYFEIDNGVPKIVNYVLNDQDAAASGVVLNEEDYSFVDFSATSYEIIDKNGNYTNDWESNGKLTFYEIYLDQIDLKLASLDNDEYYCVFKIQDIYGNVYYSKLLNIN